MPPLFVRIRGIAFGRVVQMWRFLLAGLVTVCGLVLLFMASMGDPMTELHDVRAFLPVIQSPPKASAPRPVVAAAPVAAPQTATASVPAPDAPAHELAVEQQRAELEQTAQKQREQLEEQVKSLQEKLAQSSQDMSALRNEADTEKQDVEALRQQRAAEQAALDRLKSAPPPSSKSAPPQPTPAAQTHPQAEPAKLAKAFLPENLPAPPAPKPVVAQAKQAPPSDFAGAEAVLNRLRHSLPSDTSPVATANVPPQPSDSPAARLSDARRALQAGRIDEVRSLLEQAQTQLVFRPVNVSGDMAPTGSIAAGDVAEALSMLNSGDIPDTERYINLAMRQSASEMQPVIADERSPDQVTLSRP